MENMIGNIQIKTIGDDNSEPIFLWDIGMENFCNCKPVKTSVKKINEDIFLISKNQYDAVCKVDFLVPDIEDIDVINGRVVVVSFADGKVEKAVLDDNDVFSVEQGISICLMKKLLSCRFGFGSSVYNKLVEMGMSFYNKKLADAEAQEKKKIEEEAINERKLAKAQKRKAKREAKIKAAQEAEKEKQIEIQKEAYLRAMREFNNTSETATN